MSGQPRLAGGTSGHFGMTVAFSKIPWQSRGGGELLAVLQPLAAWPLPPAIPGSLALRVWGWVLIQAESDPWLTGWWLLPLFAFGSQTKEKKPEAAGGPSHRSQPSGLFSSCSDNVLIACLASGSAGWLLLGPAGALLFFFLLEIKNNICKEPCAFPHSSQ